MFGDLDVTKFRGGYTPIDRTTGTSLARLNPIPQPTASNCSIGRSSGNVGAPSETSCGSALRSTEFTKASGMSPSSASSSARACFDSAAPGRHRGVAPAWMKFVMVPRPAKKPLTFNDPVTFCIAGGVCITGLLATPNPAH
jgi:hypothetical protein